MKLMSILAILLCVGIAALGCSTSKELTQARNSYSEARDNPTVSQHASATLNDAEMALEKAQNAKTWEKQEHYAYMAQKNVELAWIEASQAQSKMEAAQLDQEREQLSAALRRQEIEQELRAYRAAQSPEKLPINEPIFGFDEAQLPTDAKRDLSQVSEFLQNNPDRRILVEGFTDSIGSKEYNQALGKRRAEAVAQALQSEGISPDRIIVRGIGEAFPVANNDTATGRRQNRRTEITILNSKQSTEDAGN